MKPKFNILIFLCFSLSWMACESHEQAVEPAVMNENNDKLVEIDSAKMIAEEQEIIEPVESLLTEKLTDSWTQFKLEMGKSLDINDHTIVQIKRIPHLSVASLQKATTLETENSKLRMRLNKFEDSSKEVQEEFRLTMMEDLDVLTTDIEFLSIQYEIEI